jgi:hypothetical protein
MQSKYQMQNSDRNVANVEFYKESQYGIIVGEIVIELGLQNGELAMDKIMKLLSGDDIKKNDLEMLSYTGKAELLLGNYDSAKMAFNRLKNKCKILIGPEITNHLS